LYYTFLKVDYIFPILGRLCVLVGITMKGALWLRNFPIKLQVMKLPKNLSRTKKGAVIEGRRGHRIVFVCLLSTSRIPMQIGD